MTPPLLSYGTRDLRINLREAMNAVLRGEHVEITRHGAPEAYLVPADWHTRACAAMAQMESRE